MRAARVAVDGRPTACMQVGKHFEGRLPGRMEYMPNAYLRYRYPDDGQGVARPQAAVIM